MKQGLRSKTIPVTVVMLGLVSFFIDAATEMIYPLIPIFVGIGARAIVFMALAVREEKGR